MNRSQGEPGSGGKKKRVIEPIIEPIADADTQCQDGSDGCDGEGPDFGGFGARDDSRENRAEDRDCEQQGKQITHIKPVKHSCQTPVLRYAEEPDICSPKSGSSAYLRTGVWVFQS